MEIGLIRSSSLSQYSYCQQSFFITYNLGYQQPTGKKALQGTVVHKVMETLSNCKKTIQDNPDQNEWVFEDSELGTCSFTWDILMSYEFAEDLLQKSYDHYTKYATHLTFAKADYTFCKDMMDAAFTMNNGNYDPRVQNVFQAETPFNFEIEEDWGKYVIDGIEHRIHIKGTMDLITLEDEDTLHLQDYKTGARKNWATGKEKDYEYLHSDDQLMLYYYAITRLFPQYKNIVVSILFLRDGGAFTMCFEREETIAKIKSILEKHVKDVKNNRYPRPINAKRSDFRCTKLCHFYKTNWEGTDKPICNYVEDQIKLYGIENATKQLKKPSFVVGFYRSPGSTDSSD